MNSGLYTFEQDNLTYVADDRLENLRAHEPKIHEVFAKLTKKHIDASGGLMGLLPYDPDKYPAQRLDVVEVRTEAPVDLATLEGFAEAAYPQFDQIKQKFASEADQKMFSMINQDLAEARNYIFAFDHGRIINTPLGEIAALGALAKSASDMGSPAPEFVSRLTVSKMLSRISALGFAAIDLLGLQGVLDMSIPPSKTIQESGVSRDVSKNINASLKLAREELEAEIAGKKAIVDFMSPSGTADVHTSRRFGRHKSPAMVHLGPMSYGTREMMTSARILPISLNVDQPSPRAAIGNVMNPVKHADEAHRVMIEVANLAEKATRRKHVYHPTKEDFERAIGNWQSRKY